MAVWFQSDFSLAFQCGFSQAFQCGFSLVFQDVSVLHFMVGESGVELAKHARQTHLAYRKFAVRDYWRAIGGHERGREGCHHGGLVGGGD